MKWFLLFLLVGSWGVGFYLRSEVRSGDDAVEAEGHANAGAGVGHDEVREGGSERAAGEKRSADEPRREREVVEKVVERVNTVERVVAGEQNRAALAAVVAAVAPATGSAAPTCDCGPGGAGARGPSSTGSAGGSSARAHDLKPVEYIPLEEALKTAGETTKWQIVQPGNDQLVRLLRGTTSFIDKSAYYFVPSVPELEQACPAASNLKITAVLRFGADGALAEVVATDDSMASIPKDVFNCQVSPRQIRGEAVPFKTQIYPKAQ